MSTNLKCHLHVAKARQAHMSGAWQAIGREAYLSGETARSTLPDFIARCAIPVNGLFEPDPDTLTGSVLMLDLEDTLPDGEFARVFVLSAKGRRAIFDDPFQCIGRTAFTEHGAALADTESFRARCVDPDLGPGYALEEGLNVSVIEIPLSSHGR